MKGSFWLEFRRFKMALDIILKHLPESSVRQCSNIFSALKRRLSLKYNKDRSRIRLIRLCDFIITRCNGDRFIEFELSNICNAQCVFCPYPDMLRTDKKFMHMSPDILKSNIRKLEHFKSALVSFTPTTGDTLLHPEWDRYIAAVLSEKQISGGTMFTNAIKLDKENRDKFIVLLENDTNQKLSEIYFSVGGLDAETYKALYKVDRFELVVSNISQFLQDLKTLGLSIGIHIHIKLLKDQKLDTKIADKIFNPARYPFVYYSQSNLYFSNDVYTRNALIDYKPNTISEKKLSCAYLQKTRFAADGGIWADGCVISEMPGDSSLKLGETGDDWVLLESRRNGLIEKWESKGEIPLPCQGCTVYRPR